MGNGTNSFDTSFDTGRVEREEIARKRQNVTGVYEETVDPFPSVKDTFAICTSRGGK